jgi:hypothetical protein
MMWAEAAYSGTRKGSTGPACQAVAMPVSAPENIARNIVRLFHEPRAPARTPPPALKDSASRKLTRRQSQTFSN